MHRLKKVTRGAHAIERSKNDFSKQQLFLFEVLTTRWIKVWLLNQILPKKFVTQAACS